MRTDIDLVHVIFKTHLDVGFTDYARAVVDRYMTAFIPDAITLAETMRERHPDEPFRWTVGAWLIYEYLERASSDQRRRMENAVRDNHVAWHAAPFTTHTELMDERLFRRGLSLSHELDARFGKRTIAAKMTDVPGHTRAMIPLLAEAGVRMFHVGVNPAATVPAVPPVFKWRDETSSTEVLMMYQQVYGDVMVLPGTTEAVAIVFTGDNLGPPTPDSVRETYADLRRQFPNAVFVGSTLDAVAESILRAAPDLPVISDEIGDTWIHGIGTDPTKVSQYRALLRLRDRWIADGTASDAQLGAFDRALLMIPEHTWGMDLKTFLPDYENYATPVLPEKRGDPMFRYFEASWAEQRAYVADALDTLDGTPLKAAAEAELEAIKPRRPDPSGYRPVSISRFETEQWSIGVDPSTGALDHLVLKAARHTLADTGHPIGLVTYETFSSADYDRFWHQYIRDREHGHVRVWAHPDNTKPGLNVEAHGRWHPHAERILTREDAGTTRVLVEASFAEQSRQIGAPSALTVEYAFKPDGTVAIDVQWFDKPACRLPEAFWLTVIPVDAGEGAWAVHKLGGEIDPTRVVSGGARSLHGFDTTVTHRGPRVTTRIDSLDAVLVAPERPALLDFHNRLPDMAGGVHFNLYNNVWGTNFPMWFEDDARFRFVLRAASNTPGG
ncbi:MAG: DUF5054 domain-containing protein [Chloroflexi bacterium]|nr:DUF5054 domain-containing protein [Chloroflexota bacterium]